VDEIIVEGWFWLFPILVTITAALNRWTNWPHSWGVGTVTQAGQIAIALLFGDDLPVQGLILSFLPLSLFILAWASAVDERHKKQRRGRHRSKFTH
jgi:hypothetical protein